MFLKIYQGYRGFDCNMISGSPTLQQSIIHIFIANATGWVDSFETVQFHIRITTDAAVYV